MVFGFRMVRTIRNPNFQNGRSKLGRFIYINFILYIVKRPSLECSVFEWSVFEWSTIRKQTFKKFGFRMDSEFECSEFEPLLYLIFAASASGDRSLLLPRDEARASIDRVLADVGIAPVDAVLKSVAAGQGNSRKQQSSNFLVYNIESAKHSQCGLLP